MKKKPFDGVARKREIQERQRVRMIGLSPEDERQLTRAEILKHPELARLWKAVTRTVPTRQSIDHRRPSITRVRHRPSPGAS